MENEESFPLESAPPGDGDSSRRTFFTVVAAGATGLVGAALAGAIAPVLLSPLRAGDDSASARLDLGPVENFRPVVDGAAPAEVTIERRVRDGYASRRVRARVAVVADPKAASGLACLSTTCTHLGCGVSWSPARKLFLCPCHGGVYAPDGRVVSGPPPRPLERLPLVVEGGRVRVDASRLG